jgi:DNA replication protein DnaC
MDNPPSTFRGVSSMVNDETTKLEFCGKHGTYRAKVTFLGKKEFMTRCPACQSEEAAESEEQERIKRRVDVQARKQKRIESLLKQASIPPRFVGRSFENFKADTDAKKHVLKICQSMANNFDDCLKYGTSLLMCGKPGTGKSHLSAAFATTVINQGRSAAYTTVLRAIRSIKDTYRKDSKLSEQQAIDALIAPDFLVIDEIGVQFGTDTEKMYLFEILNGRYENQKPTIIITNLSQDEVVAYLGERIIDRMKEGGGGTLIFDWDSYRSNVVGDKDLPVNIPKPVDWGISD